MRMVSSGLSHICISLIVAALIVPGATLAEIELKDLAGLWLFDEGSSKGGNDGFGNKNDGKFEKGLKGVKGKFGRGLEFDGTPNFVIVPHNDLFNFADGDFTMDCWMEGKKLDTCVVIRRNSSSF